jgi:hypothetical protein
MNRLALFAAMLLLDRDRRVQLVAAAEVSDRSRRGLQLEPLARVNVPVLPSDGRLGRIFTRSRINHDATRNIGMPPGSRSARKRAALRATRHDGFDASMLILGFPVGGEPFPTHQRSRAGVSEPFPARDWRIASVTPREWRREDAWTTRNAARTV